MCVCVYNYLLLNYKLNISKYSISNRQNRI